MNSFLADFVSYLVELVGIEPTSGVVPHAVLLAVEPSQPHKKVLKLSPVQSVVEASLMKLYKKVKAHYD